MPQLFLNRVIILQLSSAMSVDLSKSKDVLQIIFENFVSFENFVAGFGTKIPYHGFKMR